MMSMNINDLKNKINIKQMGIVVLLLLLLNSVFLILSFVTHTARPLLNLDYALLFLILGLFLVKTQWKWLFWLFIPLFILTTIAESLLFAMQLFPFVKLEHILYLAPFLLQGPKIYIVLAIGLTVYMLIMPIFVAKAIKKIDGINMLLVAIIVVWISALLGESKYSVQKDMHKETFARSNFYYAQSQLRLYWDSTEAAFLRKHSIVPEFKFRSQPVATDQLTSDGRKVLLILAESFGVANHSNAQEDIILNLKNQASLYEYWKQGEISFVGATVQAEIRELCHKKIEGFFMQKTVAADYKDCLPVKMKQRGLLTIAMHGSSSLLYERFDWYAKAGFSQTLFAENMPTYKRCETFRGICDEQLHGEITKSFAQHDNLFFYWLTLTGHSPYPASDIYNNRFDCQKWGILAKQPCRNMQLQAQFMDEIAQLVKRPEMKGVEVLIVGDHIPPMNDLREQEQYYKNDTVSWLHFKIKE